MKNTLAPFQCKTADYAYKILFCENARNRFLIADETGLGKTRIAARVIEKLYEDKLREKKKINIIYICSNANIAEQNKDRLLGKLKEEFKIYSRLSQVATLDFDVNTNNFIYITPRTSFSFHGNGEINERVFLYHILHSYLRNHKKGTKLKDGLLRFMKSGVKYSSWDSAQEKVSKNIASAEEKFDVDSLLDKFGVDGKEKFFDNLIYHKDRRHKTKNDNDIEEKFINECLKKLSLYSILKINKIDLIVCDEFQNFPPYFCGEPNEDPFSPESLVHLLLSGKKTKILLLSATPYFKELASTVNSSQKNVSIFERYISPGILRTLKFLYYNDDNTLATLETVLKDYNTSIPVLFNAQRCCEFDEKKKKFAKLLKPVMSRTERVPYSFGFASMLSRKCAMLDIGPSDVERAKILQKVANELEVGDQLRYWKSIPYPINFMGGYNLHRGRFDDENDGNKVNLKKKLRHNDKLKQLLKQYHLWQSFDSEARKTAYDAHPKLRFLFKKFFEEHSMHDHLWVPPSMPYYATATKNTFSKHLVFCKWLGALDAIAVLSSLENQRRRGKSVFEKFPKKLDVPTFTWLFPWPKLAKIEPLQLFLCRNSKKFPDLKEILEKIEEKIDANKTQLSLGISEDDLNAFFDIAEAYGIKLPDQKALSSFKSPAKNFLAKMVLAGPGVCALRSLMRCFPEIDLTDLSTTAFEIACAFFKFFTNEYNLPKFKQNSLSGLVKAILKYSVDNNFQSMLDEYFHVLLSEHPNAGHGDLAGIICENLCRESSKILAKGIQSSGEFKDRSIPCYFARNLQEKSRSDDSDTTLWESELRESFNSPFAPFVIAASSMGEEGLDFHYYCNSVIHWDLPGGGQVDPIALEQREGRVHRYKCLAVRRNVAASCLRLEKGGVVLKPLKNGLYPNPWDVFWETAKVTAKDSPAGNVGLAPYWLFEGEHKILSSFLILALSEEEAKYHELMDALKNYRLLLGMPRGEDLIKGRQIDDLEHLPNYLLSLAPPRIHCKKK